MSEHDVRTAGFDDLDPRTAYLIWQLRQGVFVVEQGCPYPDLDGRDLEPGTRHLWVEVAGRPVGYLRMLEDEEGLRVGRVVVAAGHRRAGIAGRLMQRALQLIGDEPSHLDAQSYLAQWYAGFGYEPSGPEFLDDGIPHVPMVRPRGRRTAPGASSG